MKLGLRISHLLAIQSAIGLLVAVSLVGVSFWFVRTTQDTVERVYAAKDVTADILPPPMYLIEMRLVLSQVLDGTMQPARASADIERLAGEYQARVKHWEAHPPYGLEQSLLGRQHADGQRFIGLAQAFAARASSTDEAALRDALQAAHAAYQAHRAGVDDTVKTALAFAEDANAAAEHNAAAVASTQVALLALALGLLLLAGWWVRGRLAGPIRHAVEVAERIAGGNLAQPVAVHGSGETAELMAALQGMQRSLTEMVVQVRQSTEHIHTASNEIAQGNHDLSMRTEQAASSLQETAASMEQINGTVRSTAEAARQANQMVLQAAEVAARGGEVVGQAVNTMQSIHHSSQKIQDIIGVIDGIAFQTNILALNAAVEAARAGEQGRGFAVVAGEVRGLARRSATAAKEIKTLIGDSVGTVENGSRHVSEAGHTMESVVGSVRQVTDIITHISAAAAEQSNGIDQVNVAVNHLDQVTQQNAALVEQSAAAADSLRLQAHQLAETVRRFQVAAISPAG